MSNTLPQEPSSSFLASARPTARERAELLLALAQPLLGAATLLGAERVFCGSGPSRGAYIPASLLGTVAVALTVASLSSSTERSFVFADDALTVATPQRSITIRRAAVIATITVGANVILATRQGMYLHCYAPMAVAPLRSRLLAWSPCTVEARSVVAWNVLSMSWLSTSAAAAAFAAPMPARAHVAVGVVLAASSLAWLTDIVQGPAALRRRKLGNAILGTVTALAAGAILSRS